MQMDDMILVSVDDHVVEPPDMFKNHLTDEYKSGTQSHASCKWLRCLGIQRAEAA